MSAYTKPTEKPSWRLGKKEIITLVILLGLFICAVTVSQMRGSEEDTETETMTKATVAQLKEGFKESFALRELSVEKLFGKDGVKAKAFYACPKTGCSPVMSVDKVLTANNLSKSYEGFMNLHLEKHWMPVAEFNTDKSVKTILLMQHPQVGFLGKVREKGFKGAFEPSIGCSYIVSTDSSIQFEKESKKSE